MRRRTPSHNPGFTLIELLIVVAIIGIIAALLIPNFIDSLQRGRQKRTMGDMHMMGNAMMSWLTDTAGSGAAGAPTTVNLSDWTGTGNVDEIRSALVPAYTEWIPDNDAWQNPFLYRLMVDDPDAARSMLIASGGRDKNAPSGTYTVGAFNPTDYDQDLVWADGRFFRRPDHSGADGNN